MDLEITSNCFLTTESFSFQFAQVCISEAILQHILFFLGLFSEKFKGYWNAFSNFNGGRMVIQKVKFLTTSKPPFSKDLTSLAQSELQFSIVIAQYFVSAPSTPNVLACQPHQRVSPSQPLSVFIYLT